MGYSRILNVKGTMIKHIYLYFGRNLVPGGVRCPLGSLEPDSA